MTNERHGPPHSVPTLTEVVSLPQGARAVAAAPFRQPLHDPASETAVQSPSEPLLHHEPKSFVQCQPEPTPESTVEPTPESTPDLPASPQAVAVAPLHAAPAAPTEDQLTSSLLADLQRQIDLVLEYRVREALTPILARATDAIVREARSELTHTLSEVVALAVAKEMRRQRSR